MFGRGQNGVFRNLEFGSQSFQYESCVYKLIKAPHNIKENTSNLNSGRGLRSHPLLFVAVNRFACISSVDGSPIET